MKTKRKKEIEEGNYEKCWKYLKESRRYFLVIIAVFLFSVFLGFIWHPLALIEMIRRFVEDVISKTEGMGFIELFVYIFQNNLLTP